MRTREEGAIPIEYRAMIEKHLALAEVHVAQGEGTLHAKGKSLPKWSVMAMWMLPKPPASY
jgi:hypothetical protein